MEITIKDLQKKIPIPQAKMLKAAKTALLKLGRPREGSLSIVFVGAKRMRSVNKKYLDHDYVTDVLAFDLGRNVGEIIICPQEAFTNAKAHHTSTDDEIILYVIHGILHLAGFDDHGPKDEARMREMEKKLL